ncbi:MAG TPA: 6,7-dimethyl-8-ribityllumazine synthase [Dongiaceae bacterium]|jgi:6,7-dimethyl-8-ribityllumazine synthase|nr:6,7-dimethyl-8-ribityllumazine synthase [Dongiaceae bacterium]
MATKKPHIMLVEARFYAEIADALLEGAEHALKKAGATHEKFTVPGALEIPGAIRLAIEAQRAGKLKKPFDGFLALGCVIRGETTHYETVCNESARGLMNLSTEHAVCIGNGILTVENDEQAWTRARMTEKDKGGGAAEAVIALVAIRRKLGLAH